MYPRMQGLSCVLYQAVCIAGAVCLPREVHTKVLLPHGHLPQIHVCTLNFKLFLTRSKVTFPQCRHLPLYLVAAFAKKIARFALTAPPNGEATCKPSRPLSHSIPCFSCSLGVMVAVVFVSNLVKRHPNCRVLLHRANADGITCGGLSTIVFIHHSLNDF